MSKYVAVNLRKEYTDAIDKAIVEDPFVISRAEFVRRSIELFLKELEKK